MESDDLLAGNVQRLQFLRKKTGIDLEVRVVLRWRSQRRGSTSFYFKNLYVGCVVVASLPNTERKHRTRTCLWIELRLADTLLHPHTPNIIRST